MKRGTKKKGEERTEERERETTAVDQEQKCTHTSPRTEYPVDMKEIFLCSIVAWPKVN